MPRYYFDCVENGAVHTDLVGIDLDPDEIADQAQGLVTTILGEASGVGSPRSVVITVRDERGVVYTAQGSITERTIDRVD